ncbi:hypothetical protein K7472_03635 [Streptomyces sp. PTM05]|uniref:Uncharacterized protein n=1 Tax=Streptantibioticus parmotrematis TaxID=2873249 RepID=A0ABS7QL76_9ACTN|nr:hypothetical protein [Streptantibioticus parmotrematis]MBY8883933.1 hypothetical protein [Streptantibioticus parmotrematis]
MPNDAQKRGLTGLNELLTAAVAEVDAVPIDPARESAALAAFREANAAATANAATATAGVAAATTGAFPNPSPGGRFGLRRGWNGLRGLTGSAKVAVAAAFAATALVGGVAAAAGTGVIPSPFSSGDPVPEASGGSASPSLGGTASPSTPLPTGSSSGLPVSPSAGASGPGSTGPTPSHSSPGSPDSSGLPSGTLLPPEQWGKGGSGARDAAAFCAAYLAVRNGHGSAAQQRLLQQLAGGAAEQAFDAYCGKHLDPLPTGNAPVGGAPGSPGKGSGGKGWGGPGSGGAGSGGKPPVGGGSNGSGGDGGGGHGHVPKRLGSLPGTLLSH